MTEREKKSLAHITEFYNSHAADLMTCALALAEILEDPNETPRADGGRPLKHVGAIWEDAAELIHEVQKSAKHCADNLMHIRAEIMSYVDSPTTPDLEKPKRTLGDAYNEQLKAEAN